MPKICPSQRERAGDYFTKKATVNNKECQKTNQSRSQTLYESDEVEDIRTVGFGCGEKYRVSTSNRIQRLRTKLSKIVSAVYHRTRKRTIQTDENMKRKNQSVGVAIDGTRR